MKMIEPKAAGGKKCPKCKGTGKITTGGVEGPCPPCKGTGEAGYQTK